MAPTGRAGAQASGGGGARASRTELELTLALACHARAHHECRLCPSLAHQPFARGSTDVDASPRRRMCPVTTHFAPAPMHARDGGVEADRLLCRSVGRRHVGRACADGVEPNRLLAGRGTSRSPVGLPARRRQRPTVQRRELPAGHVAGCAGCLATYASRPWLRLAIEVMKKKDRDNFV